MNKELKNTPGVDIIRSITLLSALGLILYSISNVPFSPDKRIIALTYLIVSLAIVMILLSIFKTIVLWTNYVEADNIEMVFAPKKHIITATNLFFLALCIWITLLGGVLKSPYSSLLTISLLFMLMTSLFSDDEKAYRELLLKLNIQTQENRVSEEIRRIKRWQIFPFVIVAITAIAGEILINFLGVEKVLNTTFYPIQQTKIFETEWYITTSYITYYCSLFAALVSTVPPNKRKKYIKYGLFPNSSR